MSQGHPAKMERGVYGACQEAEESLVRRETRATQVKMGEMVVLEHQGPRVTEEILGQLDPQAQQSLQELELEDKKARRGIQGTPEKME